MERKYVEAQYLKVDDYIEGIASVVVEAPTTGLYTPSGKVDLKVKNKHGKIIAKQWNKRTSITILVK